MWLVVWSWLQIANATRAVARHTNNPTERHKQAVLQIIKYLLVTKDLCRTFKRGSDLDLSVYTVTGSRMNCNVTTVEGLPSSTGLDSS